ncbi:MAG: histidine phosphatase family protein [Bacteroidota bacterium]
MKTLILVRHAKSSWDYPYLADFDRPLNKRGERDAPRMAAYLESQDIQAGHFVSSPANRALTTAKTIKEKQQSANQIIEDRSLYHASSSEILRVVQNQDTPESVMMIFGHNPGFTDCANRLGNISIDNVPTCGVVGINFNVDTWSAIDFGKGEMLYFHFPKGI